MGNILKQCDQLGQTFELNFGKTSRLQSTCGGLSTIFGFCILMVPFYIFVSKYFDPSEVEISTSIQHSKEYPTMDLWNNTMYPILGFNSKDDQSFVKTDDLARYFSVKGVISSLKYEDLTDDNFDIQILESFDFVPCNSLDHRPKLQIYDDFKAIEEFGENFGLCPDISDSTNFYVKGSSEKPPFVSIKIKVFPCLLGSAPLCATEEEINGAEFNILLPVFSFDHAKFENPISIVPSFDDTMTFHPDIIIKKEFVLKTTEIFDDYIDFKGETLRKKYFDLDRSSSSVKVRKHLTTFCVDAETNCSPYIELDFVAGSKNIVIKRSYSTVTNVLGELGGVTEIIVTVVTLLYLIFSCTNADKYLVKQALNGKSPQDLQKYVDIDPNLTQKQKEKQLESAAEEMVEDNKDGFLLFQRLNEMKILQSVFLTDQQQSMLPLVLMNILKEKERKQAANKLTSAEDKSEDIMKAYNELKNSTPQNEIQKQVKEYILANLPKNLTNPNRLNSAMTPEVEGFGLNDDEKKAIKHNQIAPAPDHGNVVLIGTEQPGANN